MKSLARALVTLSGLASIGVALGLWFGIDALLPKLGLATTDLGAGLVGRATVRADIAGLFGGMGLAMLVAALRQSRAWTNVVLLFVCVAITGRFISLGLDGAPALVMPPIVIEALAILLLLWFRSGLPARSL